MLRTPCIHHKTNATMHMSSIQALLTKVVNAATDVAVAALHAGVGAGPSLGPLLAARHAALTTPAAQEACMRACIDQAVAVDSQALHGAVQWSPFFFFLYSMLVTPDETCASLLTSMCPCFPLPVCCI